MPTAKATRASDKAQICRKLVVALQKLYGKSVPRIDLPVLETMLFGICLEDNNWAAAEAGYKKLLSSYFDLNEIRVSSVNELEKTLLPLHESDWKGLRIRSLLRHVFETTYSFEYEKFRRLTQEVAVRNLKKINDLTAFVKDFAQQQILGCHVVCLDNSMLAAARWLGLVPPNADLAGAAEFLKGGLKKSEVAEFCHCLRCLATDPKFRERFQETPDHELDMADVLDRLQEVQLPPKKKAAKAPDKPAEVTPAKTTKAAEKSAHKDAPAKPATGEKPATAAAKTVAAAKSPTTAKPSDNTKKPEKKSSPTARTQPAKSTGAETGKSHSGTAQNKKAPVSGKAGTGDVSAKKDAKKPAKKKK